ncbi:MAG: hypothetical protein ABIJ41_07080 [Candidatus Omnitrophota bacterium]
MNKAPMRIDVRRMPQIPDVFEFTITAEAIRSQFRLPRSQVNRLRALLEKVLIEQ